MKLKIIGYWNGGSSPADDKWPDPRNFVADIPEDEKQAVLKYMRGASKVRYMSMGDSLCRFTGKPVGSGEYSDGTYRWPEGLPHYIENHSVRLPDEFWNHALGGEKNYVPFNDFQLRGIITDWWESKKKLEDGQVREIKEEPKPEPVFKNSHHVEKLLTRLDNAANDDELASIWEALRNELLGNQNRTTDSFRAFPKLVDICIQRELFDAPMLDLCATVEQLRHSKTGPALPDALAKEYHQSLRALRKYVMSKLRPGLSSTLLAHTLAVIATCDGKSSLGKAIMMMSDKSVLADFLEGQ